MFNKATCFDLVGHHKAKTPTIRHKRKVQNTFCISFYVLYYVFRLHDDIQGRNMWFY